MFLLFYFKAQKSGISCPPPINAADAPSRASHPRLLGHWPKTLLHHFRGPSHLPRILARLNSPLSRLPLLSRRGTRCVRLLLLRSLSWCGVCLFSFLFQGIEKEAGTVPTPLWAVLHFWEVKVTVALSVPQVGHPADFLATRLCRSVRCLKSFKGFLALHRVGAVCFFSFVCHSYSY